MSAGTGADLHVVSESAAQTRAIGAALGRRLRAGDVVLLHGDLGAGKTTLAQGIAHGLGVEGPVPSPTFTLAHEHDGRGAAGEPLRLYHLDLYRLTGDEDLDSFGFDDYLAFADGVALVEWPERAAARLPETYVLVRLEPAGEERRRLSIVAVPPGAPVAARLAGLGPEVGEPK